MIRILASVTVAAAAALAGAAPAAPAAPTERCASVPFTRMSDDVAAEIRVSGVRCAFARGFVRDSGGHPPRSFRGYTCSRHRVEPEASLVHTRYRCTRGSKLIRWNRY